MFRILHIIFWLLLACGCKQKRVSLFTELPAAHTNIAFRNTIKEDEAFNILTYEYLYNGGGVATGDLNGDGLTDVVFTGNEVPNKLYLNMGEFRFEDVTEEAGIKGRARWKTGVVLADVNGDGLLDIYVCYSGPGMDAARANELYINTGVKNGIPNFVEKATEYGLDAPGTFTTTVSFFDMDRDGDLDLFMVNHADMFYNPYYNTNKLRTTRHAKFGNRLYRNNNGVFKNISEEAGIDGSGLNFGLSVSTSDLNGDGWTDIYVTNDYDERDFLYLNNGNGTFREVLHKAAGHLSEFAMGSDIADYNNDEKPDVAVLDMLPEDNHRQKLLKGADTYDKYSLRVSHGFHHQQMRNTLQLNNGVDTAGVPVFSEVGQLAGVSNTDWSWAPLFADFDNDGWKDLFVSNGILRDITNLDFVKYTSGYTAHFASSKGDKVDMWKLIQEMPSTKLHNYLFRNNGDLTFSSVGRTWGFEKASVSNGAAYADLDNDGDLDLVVNCLNDVATVYKNNASENKHANYIRVQFVGEEKNTFGIGAKVEVHSAQGVQMQEHFTARGFQSSVDPVMHFGLGRDSLIQTLIVKWPGGNVSELNNIRSNQTLTIREKDAHANTRQTFSKAHPLFEDVTASAGIQFRDTQSGFVDFKVSALLPCQVSKIGPCLAQGDANGDGLEDVFIGACGKGKSILYLQTGDGKFAASASQPWNEGKDYTIADALFFDADGDGDNDLYLVGGGADYHLNHKAYQDQIFENRGHGVFKELETALPAETTSGSCARAADINRDGLPDLFVGGKLKPGLFPVAPSSMLLKNKSTKGHILFEKDAAQRDSMLLNPGMVTDAVWFDINHDGWPDLVTAGMFMPITVFENHQGILQNKTTAYGLEHTAGWWCRLAAADFDNDGDTDLVAGNMGLNTPFKPTATEPLTITYADFNGDGVVDPVLCSFNGGKSYPYFSRDELIEQMPLLQKRFSRYKDYADAQLHHLFGEAQLANATTLHINMLQSVYLENRSNKIFAVTPLPSYAQLSMANGIVADDVDGDGLKDIVLAGNYFPLRVQMGPLDAGIGLILKSNGKGAFSPLPYAQTGFYVPGDVRNLIAVNGRNKKFLIAAKANAPVQVLQQVVK